MIEQRTFSIQARSAARHCHGMKPLGEERVRRTCMSQPCHFQPRNTCAWMSGQPCVCVTVLAAPATDLEARATPCRVYTSRVSVLGVLTQQLLELNPSRRCLQGAQPSTRSRHDGTSTNPWQCKAANTCMHTCSMQPCSARCICMALNGFPGWSIHRSRNSRPTTGGVNVIRVLPAAR